MKTIVISGINIYQGGPLSIMNDCLTYASEQLSSEYKIIALVHNKELYNQKNVRFIEFKKSRNSWLLRLFYEYIYFIFLSKKIRAYLWFSIHDISPNVIAERKVVYCHNPSPFFKLNFATFKFDPLFSAFVLFYKFLYKFNLKSNHHIIVQQEWIREKFCKFYNLNPKKVIVAHPENPALTYEVISEKKEQEKLTLFYPAFPRVHKNFEIIGEASLILNKKGINNFEILITASGNENKYSKFIFRKYKNIDNIRFIGLKSRKEVFDLYSKVDILLFPSKLETWGLPLSEYTLFKKPIIVSDLPYAKETLGMYDKVQFFDPEKPNKLAFILENAIKNTITWVENKSETPKEPFVKNWKDLFFTHFK